LAEPDEVNPEWKRWSCVLLKPEGLYPTRPLAEGNKPAKLKAIEAALKTCDQVILATDCDREGQLIGQEILEHFGYRGRVQRALFTAQDPKTLRDAFARLKPNTELRSLYEAAVARQQADQIFNLSLTRTATKTLLGRRARGDRDWAREDPDARYCLPSSSKSVTFSRAEIVATASTASGSFHASCPAAKHRITDRPWPRRSLVPRWNTGAARRGG
jgi:DNA topoisomerase-3